MRLTKLMQFFFPDLGEEETGTYRIVKNAFVCILAIFLFGIVYSCNSIIKGFTYGIWSNLLMAASAATGLLLLKKTGSLSITATVITSGVYLNVITASILTGGVHSSIIIWMVFVPIIPVVLTNSRHAIIWSAISIASILLAYQLTNLGHAGHPPLTSRLDKVLDLIGATTVCGCLTLYYDGVGKETLDHMRQAQIKAEGSAQAMKELAERLEQDIKHRREMERKLSKSENHYRGLFENTGTAMALYEEDAVIKSCNSEFEQLSGYKKEDIIGRKKWTDFVLPSELPRMHSYYNKRTASKSNAPMEYEFPFVTKGGDEKYISIRVGMIPGSSKRIASLMDISKRKQVELQLRSLATRDDLTGICNRRHFMKKAAKELERSKRLNHPMSILMIDVDHFKNINDTYGHSAGDEVLKFLTTAISGTIRTIDLFGRVGGEEFAVLLPETEQQQAIRIAQRLRSVTQRATVRMRNHVYIQCTISIGVASLDDGTASVDDLMAKADLALYAAKRAGRNRVCC